MWNPDLRRLWRRPKFPKPGQTVHSPDGTFEVEILSTIQAPSQRRAGVYIGQLGSQEIVVKVFAIDRRVSPGRYASKEVVALRCLTEQSCAHAPTHLGYFVQSSWWTLRGRARYVLMTKVPGIALSDMDGWRSSQALVEKIEPAFKEAIDVHACGVDNNSHHTGNILWDEETLTCYIVDYERARFGPFDEDSVRRWRHLAFWNDR